MLYEISSSDGYIHSVLTLRSLADEPSLDLRPLVEGERSWELPVRWVHNTELLDPSPYVHHDELVMTNGLWFTGQDSADAFVENVCDAGAAGVIFGLRHEMPATPDELITSCRSSGLPLLELCISIPFTEITRVAAGRYADQRQQDLLDLVQRNNTLVQSLSSGSGMDGVIDVLRRDHPDLAVCVIDRFGRVLAEGGAALDDEERQRVVDALTRRPPSLDVDLGGRGAVTLFFIHMLGPRGVGATLACRRSKSDITPAELASLEQAARFLSIEAAREELNRSVEARFAGELLEMISSGSRDQREIAARLSSFGIRSDEPMAVCGVSTRNGSVADLSTSLRHRLVDDHLPAVTAQTGQDAVMIFAWPRPETDLLAFVQEVVDDVGVPSATDGEIVAGIGGLALGIADLRVSLREARETARVLTRRETSRRVRRFDELGVYRALLGHCDPAILQDLAAGVLTAIDSYDRAKDGRLRDSVRMFLNCDGNWNDTAAALYIHVNTLRNRLGKVTELTGLNITRTEDRVELFLALEASESALAR